MHKFLILFFVIFFSKNVLAGQALPISPMQRVFSAGVQIKAAKRGFAVNDPRYAATLNSMSFGAASVAGTTAAAVVAGAITAPAWATVAIAAGVGAVVTFGINVAINGAIEWMFSPNENDPTPITQKRKPKPTPPSNGGLVEGGEYWKTNNYMASDAMSTIQAAFADAYNSTYSKFKDYNFYLDGCGADSPTTFNCIVKRVAILNGATTNYSNFRAGFFPSGAPRNCPQGQVSNSTGCITPMKLPENVPNVPNLPNVPPEAIKLTVPQAINNLSPAELEEDLSPEIIIPIFEKLWRDAAAKPGYAGLPYLPNDPLTVPELVEWKNNNAADWPQVHHFVDPQPAVNKPWSLPPVPSSSSSAKDPSANPPSSTNTNPAAENPLQNIGPDPNIGAPRLEDTPTAQQILQPLFNLFPDFRSFVMPSHQSVCPKPSFDAFGSTYVLESHCKIAEEQRSILFSVMGAVWLLAAAIIILRA